MEPPAGTANANITRPAARLLAAPLPDDSEPMPALAPSPRRSSPKRPAHASTSRCRCGRPVFFRNTRCLGCGTPLGYEPALCCVLPLQAGAQPGDWLVAGGGGLRPARYRRCANLDRPARCNWLVPVRSRGQTPPACLACRLNRTIPDLAQTGNGELWRRIEAAKCRLVAQMVGLRLPVASLLYEDPAHGLAFDFLRAPPGAAPVVTGHHEGIITIDVEEADDARRERLRQAMGEPYRTLIGHFRHEIGHYLWDRLVERSAWLEPFRALFGQEQRPYGDALAAYYRDGPPAGWQDGFISAYATAHPWEDWAESWAHYLHMADAVETAERIGIDAAASGLATRPFGRTALWRSEHAGAARFLRLLNDWVRLAAVMNEMSRSMGQPDFYPFVLSAPVVAKLHFIHCLIGETGRAAR